MSSHRRKPGKPIESVRLKVTFRGERRELSKIIRAVPGASWKSGAVELTIEGRDPSKVAESAKAVSDRVRAALGPSKSSKRL